MASFHGLSVYGRPPKELREVYKKFQKMKNDAVDRDEEILDFRRGLTSTQKQNIRVNRWQDQHDLTKASALFTDSHSAVSWQDIDKLDNLVYEHVDMPGLLFMPSILSPAVQEDLLSGIMHRDLSNSMYNTNLHIHYDLPYAAHSRSFFTYAPSADVSFRPKHPDLHKALSISQVMNRKLRWLTLGGQYDWTEKRYPIERPPQFPTDIATLMQDLFPSMVPEAAIVNLYSPGDTLSLHRDISEESENGLASLSIGCDGVFVVGRDIVTEDSDRVKSVVVRLRSGDAVFMDGPSRFAWHGVPQIIRDTCPSWLQNWPATGNYDTQQDYEQWRGWMRTKRVNINVRQMRDCST